MATEPESTLVITTTTDATPNEDILSHIPEFRASEILQKYCPPVLLVLGGFGNVATIFVLRRINWGQSTQHVFLTALAVVDLLLLYTGLLDEWLWEAFGADVRGVHVAFCKIHEWLLYALGDASAWLLTAVTAQRTMSVVWPHRITSLCTMKRSVVTVLGLVLGAFILHSPNLYTRTLIDGDCIVAEGMETFDMIWHWVDLCTMSIVPSLILLFCNTYLALTLCRSARDASRLGGDTANADGRKRMARSMTITVMFLSVTFLLLTLPLCVFLLWERYVGERIFEDEILLARYHLLWSVTNMLWYTNSAVNFLLYCVSGTKFRNEFVTWITCGCGAAPGYAEPPRTLSLTLHQPKNQ